MMQDNNLVRVLAACETMGGATTICSDKTGTLTQNRMTVVAGLLGMTMEFKEDSGIQKAKERLLAKDEQSKLVRAGQTQLEPSEYLHLIQDGLALNSTAFQGTDDSGAPQFIGSKTEVGKYCIQTSFKDINLQNVLLEVDPDLIGLALLEWIGKMGLDNFQSLRNDAASLVVQVYPFSSERKSMTTVVKRFTMEGTPVVRIYTKGASEIVLKYCESVIEWSKDNETFHTVPMTDSSRSHINSIIAQFAGESLRTIVFGYRDLSEKEFESLVSAKALKSLRSNVPHELSSEDSSELEKYVQSHLVMLGLVGIEDPLREGVTEAVEKCQRAGVFVRMVTGDNVNTAKAIAKKCGIYMKGGIVMEGSRFRKLSEEDMDAILPRLQVLARSSPTDKQILVRRLKELGETVAVTGDGK
jgi:Ca2+-transporting ATPase